MERRAIHAFFVGPHRQEPDLEIDFPATRIITIPDAFEASRLRRLLRLLHHAEAGAP